MSKNIGTRTIDFLRHTASAQIQPSVTHTKLAITQSHCQTASPVQDAQPSDVKMTTVQLHNERRRNGQRVQISQHNYQSSRRQHRQHAGPDGCSSIVQWIGHCCCGDSCRPSIAVFHFSIWALFLLQLRHRHLLQSTDTQLWIVRTSSCRVHPQSMCN
jgi:hypothetical protein